MITDAAVISPVAPVPATRPVPSAAPHVEPAPQSAPSINPSMRVELALNIVVLEFRDASGSLTTSIPTPRELDAYRNQGSAAHHEPDVAGVDLKR